MDRVKIVEVGPRDGLQHIANLDLSLEDRIAFINRLTDCGLPEIEVGSFVSPMWVPQMAVTEQLFASIRQKEGVLYTALVPNAKGYAQARQVGVRSLAIFTSATESFSQKNINCSMNESFARFSEFVEEAKKEGLWVRGYVSCAFHCPYEGAVLPSQVIPVVERLLNLGCNEISLGDTIGKATSSEVHNLIHALPTTQDMAMHFHDTFGHALENVKMSLDQGIRIFDGSVAGLGGCPYAPGASGNVATEELVALVHQRGFETGINLDALYQTAIWIRERLAE